MADVKQELEQKLERDGAIGFLDADDVVERVLPGPSEEERNLSRLRKIITGEARPVSHTAKETAAWTGVNVLLPVLAAGLKSGSVIAKGTKGLQQIKKAVGATGNFQKAVKTTEKLAQKAVKDATKEAAKADAKRASAKNPILRAFLEAQLGSDAHNISLRAAKKNLKDVETAIEATSKYAPDVPEKMIKRMGLEKGAKVLAGTTAGERVLNGITSANNNNYGETDKNDYRIDKRAEMSVLRRAWQFLKSLVDLDDLDPSKYPMDLVNNLLVQWNADTNVLKKEQLDRLGDDEKIKMIKDIIKGKYNDFEDVSKSLVDRFTELTNTNEE